VQDPNHGEFRHPYFRQGKPELLEHIKRKVNKAPDPTAEGTTKSKQGKGKTNGKGVSSVGSSTGSRISGGNVGSAGTSGSNRGVVADAGLLNTDNADLLDGNIDTDVLISPSEGSGTAQSMWKSGVPFGSEYSSRMAQNYGDQSYFARTDSSDVASLNLDNFLPPIISTHEVNHTSGDDQHLPYYIDEGNGIGSGRGNTSATLNGGGNSTMENTDSTIHRYNDDIDGNGLGVGMEGEDDGLGLGLGIEHGEHQQRYSSYRAHQEQDDAAGVSVNNPMLVPDDIVSETSNVQRELRRQRQQREIFEKRMEQKLSKLQGENNMLKAMFMESHSKNAIMQERMERVMKVLYHMYKSVGGVGSSGAPALTGRMPVRILDSSAPMFCVLCLNAKFLFFAKRTTFVYRVCY
jgi:hypothetical protein